MSGAQKKHMDRLRAARGLPPQTRENIMQRTQAAVGYINATDASDRTRLSAFMSIFHPEIDEDTVRKMLISTSNEKRR